MTSESPSDLGIGLMGDLVEDVLMTADLSGQAYLLWAGLTDRIDGPLRLAGGLTHGEIEGLMRLAAREWLDLSRTPCAGRQVMPDSDVTRVGLQTSRAVACPG